MLRSVTALRGDVILARDGDMGLVVDVYFDDERWSVRYLVVDTGHVMPERRVLIAPGEVVPGQPSDRLIRVRLTRNEVERSRDARTDLPVAMQFDLPQPRRAAADPHLRSSELVIGYQVQALDGPAGHLRDFVFDDGTWSVVRLVVDTGRWFGSRVLISPALVKNIDWPWRRVNVGLDREALRQSTRA
ncbi:MAG TPA: hypothetical protein VKE95_20055 [Burkholderiales bacterium]|nr:hypothetical protein [Burkholderiales bacterium]